MPPQQQFQRRLLLAIGKEGMRYVRPKIPSRTLRKGLNLWVASERWAYIQIPHYWALYVHDGRRPFRMPAGRFMCWFRDPRQDPRLRGGHTPERAHQLRHLSPSEFYHWLRENRRAVEAGLEPPMIVTRAIRKPTPPSPFFENRGGGGMQGFVDIAQIVARPIVQDFMRQQFKSFLNVEDTARGSLP